MESESVHPGRAGCSQRDSHTLRRHVAPRRSPPPPSSGPRIAILGGSFDPPHLGHRAICRQLLLRGFDEVWVVPCWKHAFGKKLAPFEHRLTMCRLLLKGLPRVNVLDVERRLGGVSRTVQTLAALRAEHPRYRFAFVLGSDAMSERSKWLAFDEIRRLARIVVIPRPGSSRAGPFLSPLSSTSVRERSRRGLDLVRQVGVRVAAHIARHRLYPSAAARRDRSRRRVESGARYR